MANEPSTPPSSALSTEHSALVRRPIRVLPPTVAERIAAGEVIERPVSVVKELIENAIDAGATEIAIEVRRGGLQLIRVTDNGCGIPHDEVEVAFRRHATSKLQGAEELFGLRTLGFRGEALPSIAAIAEVTMVTAADESGLGTLLGLRAGRLVEQGRRARPRGTTVIVRDLFHNVPARLKFLGAARTEAALVGQLVRHYALAYPALRLSLTADGCRPFQSSGSGRIEMALAEAYGPSVAAMMAPFGPAEVAGATVRGYISNRGLTRPSRRFLSVVVNGRWALPKGLLVSLEAAYRPFLPRGRHPIVVCYVELPAAAVDVNVHPAKTEVKLLDEAVIGDALAELVHGMLGRQAAVPAEDVDLRFGLARPDLADRRLAETPGGWGDERTVRVVGGSLPPLRIVGQVEDSLVLAETEVGLLLIDQHRAHERVIYEQLRRHQEQSSQPGIHRDLAEPMLLELRPRQAAVLAERLAALADLGFVVERFGGHAFLVRALPDLPGEVDPTGALAAIEESAAAEGDWQDRLLVSLACRSAVRKGKSLTLGEQRELLVRLNGVTSPAICPHGSPVILQLSRGFLRRQFNWG